MYAAKSHGKNRYETFNPSIDAKASERMQLENQIRRAIEREEFEVRYQPIIELGSARVASLEALARWRPLSGDCSTPRNSSRSRSIPASYAR